jgi:uncharacterized protein
VKRFYFIACLVCCVSIWAAEVIPPAPAQYFNDYANVAPRDTARRLNQELEDFEKATSSQILVAVFPKMQSDSSMEDYTVRIYDAWKPGLKKKDNAAILFVFVQDRKTRIATGYGLEGAMPDALCKRIIDNEITPRFKQGDFGAGLSAGVSAMIAATKGEYKGTGRTVNQSKRGAGSFLTHNWFALLFVAFILLGGIQRRRHGYSSGWMVGSGGLGGWSGGGGGGGGGGFSGGGGSTGGGGASGSW